MSLLRELLELSEGLSPDQIARNRKTLEDNEKSLKDLLEKMKKSLEAGEFSAIKLLCRHFEFLADKTNNIANALADAS